MWSVYGTALTMTEGDYGIKLPVTIKGVTLTHDDSVAIVIVQNHNGTPILTKEFTEIQNNTVNLEFTQEESALFRPRNYLYRLDWYQNGNFMCNIIPEATFKVVDKA